LSSPESDQIKAPQSAPIKMETPWVFDNFTDSDLKLREEALPKLARNLIVFRKPTP
jgi:transglutaminase/protease-like cytokinesis protein 3